MPNSPNSFYIVVTTEANTCESRGQRNVCCVVSAGMLCEERNRQNALGSLPFIFFQQKVVKFSFFPYFSEKQTGSDFFLEKKDFACHINITDRYTKNFTFTLFF